ncbi:MAG: tripartite tricarboxylate transporter substrate binding protein [Betaproteobacteria bacterium]|nr:tripartite tricarboxylate transporter substrate binding protein [Betaproteobacteria bacterium]
MTSLQSSARSSLFRITALCLAAMAATLAGAFSAIAQPYPARPITLIVPFPPGGPTDTSARLIGKALSERLKQAVLVENRAGAGGTLGIVVASKAAPDGYTLVWAGTSFAIAAAYGHQIGYDPVKSFAPIGLVARGQQLLIGRLNLEYASLKDLVAASKASPGRLTYGSVGSGSAPHLVAEYFKSVSGANLVHVPYKGGAQSLNDLQGGHIDVMFNTVSQLAPHVKAGRVKPYAVTGKARDPLLPEVPTIGEALNVDFETYFWMGLAAPAGTPAATVNRLSGELNQALADKQLRESMFQQGLEPVGGTPENFEQTIVREVQRWSAVIKAQGIKRE